MNSIIRNRVGASSGGDSPWQLSAQTSPTAEPVQFVVTALMFRSVMPRMTGVAVSLVGGRLGVYCSVSWMPATVVPERFWNSTSSTPPPRPRSVCKVSKVSKQTLCQPQRVGGQVPAKRGRGGITPATLRLGEHDARTTPTLILTVRSAPSRTESRTVTFRTQPEVSEPMLTP